MLNVIGNSTTQVTTISTILKSKTETTGKVVMIGWMAVIICPVWEKFVKFHVMSNCISKKLHSDE